METKIDVYGADWEVFDERYRYLEELQNVRDLSAEEEQELIQLNEKFSLLTKYYEESKGTTERDVHPGAKFFTQAMDTTNKSIEKALDFGQPMSFPLEGGKAIIVHPNEWGKGN